MAIEIYDGNNWNEITNPKINTSSGFQDIEKGEIYDGNNWQTFYERFVLIPQNTAVSNVSSTVSHLTQASLTFKFQHPGEPDKNTPVRIEYRLKNSSGTVIETDEQTFSSGPIDQNVTFSNRAFSSLHTFEARAVYTSFNETTAYSSVNGTTSTLTHSLTTSPASSVNEGSTMTATFTTNNTSSREYYWKINHLNNVGGFTASAADFSAPLSGDFFASNSSNGSFTINVAADLINEGPETFGIVVAAENAFLGILGSVTRTINNTPIVAPTVSLEQDQLNSLTFRVQHPGDTVNNTAVSITRSLLDNTTFEVVSGPTTTTAVTDATNQTFTFSGLFSNRSYTFVATANYPTYGLNSTATISASTLNPAPIYSELSVSSNNNTFMRGEKTTISFTTTNVPDNTKLYWRAVHASTNGTVNSDFSQREGEVTINNNAGSFNVQTNHLNVTPGIFALTTTSTDAADPSNNIEYSGITANNISVRGTTESIATYTSTYRGNANFTVELYSDSGRDNRVRFTSALTITPENYRLRLRYRRLGTTSVDATISWPGPGNVLTTAQVNEIKNNILESQLLQPLTQYSLQMSTVYLRADPDNPFGINEISVDATNVTRSTFRNPSDLTATVFTIHGSTFSLIMNALSGAIPNSLTGTGNCTVQFRLLRVSSSNTQTVLQYYSVNNAANDVISSGDNIQRTFTVNMPLPGSYRFEARSNYTQHGSDKRVGPWIRSPGVFTR